MVDLLMFSVELLFVLVLVSALACPARGGEADTEFASASALAAAHALEWFYFFFPPWWRHDMARMVICVSGQRQKHGASQLGEIAKWLLRFSGDHPDSTRHIHPADPAPPPAMAQQEQRAVAP